MRSTRGKSETDKLKDNVQEQLSRLVTQLSDLEELREELEDEEYEEMREDTLLQLKEFQASLTKMMAGNMTLVDEFGSVQLAMQAAVSSAFKTPAVIRMFAVRDKGSLRGRLSQLQASNKMGKLTYDSYVSQAVEILAALKRLGESLTPEEDELLQANRSQALADFDAAPISSLGAAAKKSIIDHARNQAQSAEGIQ